MSTIFVTGATGNVGTATANCLLQAGHTVRAAKLRHEATEDRPGLEFVDFDFTDAGTWGLGLEGVSKVLLMRPPHISNIKRDMLPFLRELRSRPIEQVLFLSVQGAEKNSIVPHAKVEKFCIDLGMPYTFVRPSFFMQNLTTTHLAEIRDERRVFVPTGRGRTNFIDVRDIGEINSLLLSHAGHLGRAYTITGNRSYSYEAVAERLSWGLGRSIEFVSPGPLRFIAHHRRRGRSLAMTLVMLALYSVVKSGNGDITTATSEEILGRKTRSLDEFIADHRSMLSGG